MADITFSSYSVGVVAGAAFEDTDDAVSKGLISAIEVRWGAYIDAVHVFYGDGQAIGDGGLHGGTGGQLSRFEVPRERTIKSIEGHWDATGLRRLQFVLDDGTRSASFGSATGTAFTATAPKGAYLVRISGYANTQVRKLDFRWFPFEIMASSPAIGGGGGAPFEEDMKVVFRGPITAVQARSGSLVDGVRFFYGADGIGDLHGGGGGTLNPKWVVPDGHRITRVEGRAGTKIDQLQFFTDKGEASPIYGGGSGTPFTVLSPIEGGELATMRGRSGAVLDQVEFVWSLPCRVESLEILDEPKFTKNTAKPSLVGGMDLVNQTSVEQEVTYSFRYETTRSRTLSFSTTIGHTVGAEVKGKIEGVAEAKVSYQFSIQTQSTSTYTNELSQERSWSTVVRIPAMKRVTVKSTIRQSTTSVSFKYTVGWYESDNSKAVYTWTGIGVYTDVMTDDLQHELIESAPTA